MSKLFVQNLVTLDGYVERSPWGLDWHNVDAEFFKGHEEEIWGNLGGKDIVVFGSSDLCVSLLEAGMLDEVRLIVNPVLLGKGKPMFQGLKQTTKLELLRTRTFANGNVLLVYAPAKA